MPMTKPASPWLGWIKRKWARDWLCMVGGQTEHAARDALSDFVSAEGRSGEAALTFGGATDPGQRTDGRRFTYSLGELHPVHTGARN
jgi:hypothetical protein